MHRLLEPAHLFFQAYILFLPVLSLSPFRGVPSVVPSVSECEWMCVSEYVVLWKRVVLCEQVILCVIVWVYSSQSRRSFSLLHSIEGSSSQTIPKSIHTQNFPVFFIFLDAILIWFLPNTNKTCFVYFPSYRQNEFLKMKWASCFVKRWERLDCN